MAAKRTTSIILSISVEWIEGKDHVHCDWFVPAPDGAVGGATCTAIARKRVRWQDAERTDVEESSLAACDDHVEDAVAATVQP
jgi:hypothetical protein